jgi:hypothetical protein
MPEVGPSNRLSRAAIRTNVNDGFNEFDRPVIQYKPES